MATQREEDERIAGNGQNGAVHERVTLPEVLDGLAGLRKSLALLVLTGSVSDAQVLYYSIPGSSLEGWSYIERAAAPLRAYVIDGDPTYIRPLALADYRGVPTPDGDCAEDALPLEKRNPARAAAKEQIKRNGENGHASRS